MKAERGNQPDYDDAGYEGFCEIHLDYRLLSLDRGLCRGGERFI